ncbi:TPA: amino acid adenylation domain-containing protein [Legionella pneumophila subsp. pneumophila]|nr:amino acid adenylation domain-containing protein [Legionella pneumophila subsp. pneumophila]
MAFINRSSLTAWSTMIKSKTFSCYIIGEANITLQCADILLAGGHKLLGIISPSNTIKKWCTANSIAYLENIKEFEKNHMDEEFDFLFSIVNSEIIPQKILRLPRYYAINYHNSPLPKYAGLYATSWAILNGETQHGISWHIMNEVIDAGDILKQPTFPINAQDTAFSLNLKCYEQGIYSFHELVEELSSHTTTLVKQNLSYRSYYGLKNKPANFGFISWEESSESIDRLCRALTFGNYTNQLEVPKIMINKEIYVVKSYEKLNISSGVKPGTIVNNSNGGLQVATGTTDILILELTDLEGRTCSMEQLGSLFKMTCYSQLDTIEPAFFEKLTICPAKKPKIEKFWVNEFLKCSQEKNSFLSPLSQLDKTSCSLNDRKTVTHVPGELLAKLKKLCPEHWQIKNILLTGLLIYLYRLNNYSNLSIAFINSQLSSNDPDLNKLLSDYIPLTTQFDSTMTFTDALTFVSKEQGKLYENSTYTRDIFIRYPELHNAFNHIDISITFITDSKAVAPCVGNKKLNFCIAEDCSWFYVNNKTNYRSHLESYAFFENMNEHLLTLLEDIVSNPDKKIFELSIISKKEKNDLLVIWNNTQCDYDYEKPIHQYFEEQVSKTPEEIAAVFDDKSITYAELNRKANQLAHYLRSQGVKQDDLVGISLSRSLEMVICILGILKSGGAYLPLDPNYPDERISYMLMDSKTNLLITDQEFINRKPHGFNGKSIEINSFLNLKNLSSENLQAINKPSDLAYIIYTSGTTGKPKGVAISHRSICNHMLWMKKEYAFKNKDVFLQKTPFSFDASVWEFFMPLLVGGKLVVAPNDAHTSPNQMIRLIRENKVSVLQIVPSMLKELVSNEEFGLCKSLTHVFCGGEALLSETINAFFKYNFSDTKLHNLYGPTEVTIDTTAYTCTAGDAKGDVSRIGKPIMNTKVYVLDTKMQPVPVGIMGELYISGDGLARGYLNNPEFTIQKFLPNPFSNNKNDRLYRTGDLVKWDSNGVLEYHGRCDNQVKIRGYRIEINEIESYLEKIPSIHQCIVKPEKNQDDSMSLSAYLVLEKNSQISAVDIRTILKQNIPEYMIPARFYIVDKFFSTPSGKIDRKILPIPSKRLRSGANYAPPNNSTEQLLHNIWCSVLKIDNLGIYDDFFELGGNSLSAMNIISRIREQFSLTLSVRTLFDFPTISSLSKEIENIYHKKADCIYNQPSGNNIIPLRTEGEKTPLFLVHPIGGSVFWYKLLGQYFDKDRPLYGIQDPGLDRNELIFSNLEEMASAYVHSIQAIQPSGPYILGGASFGCTVAIEMAKQLEEKGETVISIISLDGWAFYPSLQNNELYFQEVMKEQNSRILKKYIENNVSNSEFLLELQWHRENMLTQYKMPIIKPKFILFKAKKLTEMFQYNASLNWWENYTSQPIELHLTPGDHESMFYEPNIKILATKLNDSLNEQDIKHYQFNDTLKESFIDQL